MQSVISAELLGQYQPSVLKNLKFLTDQEKLVGLFGDQPQKPVSLQENLHDPNDFYITPKLTGKKHVLLGPSEPVENAKETHEERKKNYKPGVFALFYEINQGKLEKDAEAWFYKEHKEIIGPVSSYNMDKMAYFKKVDDQTRVAFKAVDKFVKFAKIRKVVETAQEEHKDE